MICPNCGETVPIFLKRTRSVTLTDGFQNEIHFTDTPNEEKTKDDIKAEKDYYKAYDKLYKDTIKDMEDRVAALDILDAEL